MDDIDEPTEELKYLGFRLSRTDHYLLRKKVRENFSSVSRYLRVLIHQDLHRKPQESEKLEIIDTLEETDTDDKLPKANQ